MKLTDNEKRDIIKYLEADKPLPDAFHFLLFEEKREIELVWNGKTNEVCNVALPFQTIEHVDVSYIEVKPHIKGNSVAVELTDFSVFYSHDSIANAEATLKNKGRLSSGKDKS